MFEVRSRGNGWNEAPSNEQFEFFDDAVTCAVERRYYQNEMVEIWNLLIDKCVFTRSPHGYIRDHGIERQACLQCRKIVDPKTHQHVSIDVAEEIGEALHVRERRVLAAYHSEDAYVWQPRP